MSSAAAFLKSIALDRIIRERLLSTQKSTPENALIAFSGVTFLIGSAFIIYAFSLWVSKYYPVETAMLLTALAIYTAGVFTITVYAGLKWYRAKRTKKFVSDTLKSIITTIDQTTPDFEKHIANHPVTAVLLAALAGYGTSQKIKHHE